MPRIWIAVLGLLFALSAITPGALAQSNSYKQTNLASDTAGVAANVDPNLVNPWGIAFFPNNPFWIADNNSGFTTLYNVVKPELLSAIQNGLFGKKAIPHGLTRFGSTFAATPAVSEARLVCL